MNFKYMVICGEDVTAAVFTDKTGTELVRFQVEGTWSTSGYAGLADDRMDYLMSETEQTIVSMEAEK